MGPRRAIRGQPKLDRTDNLARDLILEGEDIGEVPVVTVGPDVRAGRSIDQLRRDAHPIAELAHASFDNVADRQFSADLRHADGSALVNKSRVARGNQQTGDLREVSDQIFG